MENKEPNKKKIIKYNSYGAKEPSYTFQTSLIKSEQDENQLSKSILKRNKASINKKVLFNFEKIDMEHSKRKSKFHQISSFGNESMLKTNNTKEPTELNNTFKKNTENKINNFNNDINNNQISTENKIIFRNKSQENIIFNPNIKKYYLRNRRESKESEDENMFNINLVNDINIALNSKQSENSKTNFLNQNIRLSNFPSQDINLETLDKLGNSTQYPIEKDTQKENDETLPKISSKKARKKMSFLLKSKKKKVSANEIIIHYIKENERDNSKNIPFNEFTKYLKNNEFVKFNYGIDKIYGNTKSFLRRVEEIKKNNVIAYKNDFNIENYQNTLLKILKKRVTEKSYNRLQKSYKLFNERNFDIIIPRGRYVNLAERLKDFLSKDIYEKMKRTDKNYLLYLTKKEAQKSRMEKENQNRETFYKKLNMTVKSFNKKMKRNQSY